RRGPAGSRGGPRCRLVLAAAVRLGPAPGQAGPRQPDAHRRPGGGAAPPPRRLAARAARGAGRDHPAQHRRRSAMSTAPDAIGLVDGSADTDSRTVQVVLADDAVVQLDDVVAIATTLPDGTDVVHYG